MARGFSHSGRSSGSRGGGGFSFGGGGGRSSSGGGFSFGSSRSSSSSSSHNYGGSSYGGSHHHYHRRPRRPWHVPMFGRTVIISTRAQSLFSLFLIVFAAACFICYAFMGYFVSNNREIKYQKAEVARYEEYDLKYKDIIDKAIKNVDGYYLQTVDVSDFSKIEYYDDDPTSPGFYETDIWYNHQQYYFLNNLY